MSRQAHCPITEIPIYDTLHDVTEPVFILSFIGLSISDLVFVAKASVPGGWNTGGQIIRDALYRRGFDPDRYRASMFDLRSADQSYAQRVPRLYR